MDLLKEYSLPIAALLIILVFYLNLPELGTCSLGDGDHSRRKITRRDVLVMAVISLIYGFAAFYKLGYTDSPQSFEDLGCRSAVVHIESRSPVHELRFFTGVGMGEYSFEYSPDGLSYYPVASFTQTHADVLKWHSVYPSTMPVGGYLRITGAGNMWLGEVQCIDSGGLVVPLSSSASPALCDEQNIDGSVQNYMNSSYFDEVYHARTAWEHLNAVPPYEISHPPLGKIIISIGISLFGMTPFGWRFSGTMIGVLMLPVMYVFLKKLFGGRAVPAAGTVVFAADFMHFTQTRIATIDSYSVFFILLMYLFMYLFLTEDRMLYLALSGIFFGMGAASKWTCIYAGGGLAVIWLVWVILSASRGRLSFKGFLKNAGFCVIFFVLVPGLIYYLAYIPYAEARGGVKLFSKDYLDIVVSNQKYMFDYHTSVEATHPYSSRWYQWILNIRPILYYLEYFDDNTYSNFGAFLNPALCWGGLLALFVLGYLAIFRRDLPSAFILWGYLAQLLPWLLVERLTFEYHYFPCSAFLVLAIGRMFALIRDNVKKWRIPVYGYAVFCCLLFLLFYPVISGARVDRHIAHELMAWFPTWPF